MAREAAITVRLPAALKRRLETRAKRQHRSLSGQVVYELERSIGEEERTDFRPALGMFPHGPIPTEEDFREVRAQLWGRLGERDG
jgi:hypothetical protein